MAEIEIYKNYGVLTKEKRSVYTYGNKHPHAICSDKIVVEIPEGWKLCENVMGQKIVEAPWGWAYDVNDVLFGNTKPCFIAVNPEGKQVRHDLKIAGI